MRNAIPRGPQPRGPHDPAGDPAIQGLISALPRAWATFRTADWWAYKIPPLLATVYGGAVLFSPPPAAWRSIGAALAAILMVAVFGYVLNDLCDIEADRRSGQPNRLASVATPWRALLVASPAVAAVTLAITTGDRILVSLVAINLLLPALYSVPPVRLKGRGLAGALADAAGVHALPMAIVARAVTAHLGDATGITALFIGSAVGWTTFAGVRGIVVHQAVDLAADRAAGVRTFVARIGVDAARRLVWRWIFPAELIALTAFLVMLLPAAPILALFVAAFVVLEVLKVRERWSLPMFEPAAISREPYVPVVNNELYEVWLPVGLCVQLAVANPRWWVVAGAHVVLFLPNIRVRLRVASTVLSKLARRGVPPSYRVVIGATTWVVNGVNVFSGNLARELVRRGVDAHVLLTEEATDLAQARERPMPPPAEVPFALLPVGRTAGWGAHWGAMIRYLGDAAPCVYMPNSDWRHSTVCPLLPHDVIVVGVVHSDDPLHYDHVRRLGPYWNVIVAVSDAVAARTAELCPELADRITTIPIGVRIASTPPQRAANPDRLRAVYHGVLKQHQKRVLDLPRIAAAAVELGIPFELTIVGAGPDEASLRASAAPLIDAGVIRMIAPVSPDEIPAIVEAHDVYLLASEFEGMPNALIEAMGRGCVPIVSRMTSGIPELVRDGDNGFLVPIGDAEAFASRLNDLWQDPDRRARMSRRAYRTVARRRFRVEHMARSYERVFEQAWRDARSGRYVRPAGLLMHPPPAVEGVSLFPVRLDHHEPGVGAFESVEEAEEFADRLADSSPAIPAGAPTSPSYVPGTAGSPALDGLRVFVSVPIWTSSGVNHWAEDVVRGLRATNVDACLLLTEESTPLVTVDAPRMNHPTDIPVEVLRVNGRDNWGARWGALLHMLEEAAPCVLLCTNDWRHAAVTPLLSDRVVCIGVIHDDDASYVEQAGRLAGDWNAVVAGSRSVAQSLRRSMPEVRGRLVTIPHGVDVRPARARPASTTDRPLSVLVTGVDGGQVADVAEQLLLAEGGHLRVCVAGPVCATMDRQKLDGVSFVPHPNRQEWNALFAGCDFLVTLDDDHDTSRRVLDAMGWSCIPVMLGNGEPGGLVRDGDTGIVAPLAGMRSAIDRMIALGADAEARASIASRARDGVLESEYRAHQMIRALRDVIARALSDVADGTFHRTGGLLRPPPPQVGGVDIFPVALTHPTRVGLLPTEDDATRFAEETGRDIVLTEPS